MKPYFCQVNNLGFELMETRDLTEEGFRPRRGGVCRETNPRANIIHCLALVTISQ